MATIDLSQLPAPDVVEQLDYESLLEERKTTLISLYPADQQEAISRTLTGNLTHSGGRLTSNGIVVHTHRHSGVQTGNGQTGVPQ